MTDDTCTATDAEADLSAEEVHLLRSAANASRLFAAIDRALANEGQAVEIDDLRHELGLSDEE